jgi:hypothetical protein
MDTKTPWYKAEKCNVSVPYTLGDDVEHQTFTVSAVYLTIGLDWWGCDEEDDPSCFVMYGIDPTELDKRTPKDACVHGCGHWLTTRDERRAFRKWTEKYPERSADFGRLEMVLLIRPA